MEARGADGEGVSMSTATIETTGVQIITANGDEISYSRCFNVTGAIERSPIFPSGTASGAVVALLGIDDMIDVNEIRVESPTGQSDLETIERTIAMLTEVRDAFRKMATA
jgi:hypothetical protein